MMPDERERLLALLHDEDRWCQGAEARDHHGDPVRYDDVTAVAWDITGALCFLFGWRRACVLFRQLDRHIFGQQRHGWFEQSPELASMAALQDYNDDDKTTYEMVISRLRTVPVWHGSPRSRDCS